MDRALVSTCYILGRFNLTIADLHHTFHFPAIAKAVLRSTIYGNVDGKCEMSFWFHKKGDDLVTMRVNIYSGVTDSTNLPEDKKSRLFAAVTDYGKSWQNITVGIGARKGGFVLEFEGVKLFSAGDLAIDDIQFKNCAPGMLYVVC